MSKRLATVQDHVDDILQARAALAGAKFTALPPGAEKPSDILAGIITALKDFLLPVGFSYNKGKRTFRRKSGDFEHLITIQSDSNNYAGVRAACWVHISVVSNGLKAWRSANHIHESEYVFSKTLSDETSLSQLAWDFIAPEHRIAELHNLLHTIQITALPVFEDWISVETANQVISSTKIINRLDDQAEIALWLGNKTAAIEILRRNPDRQSVHDGMRELALKFGLPAVV